MLNRFSSKVSRLVVLPVLVLGMSMSAFATNHFSLNHSKAKTVKASFSGQLKRALATDAKKRQFEFIRNKLAANNLPKDLALIPVIESHYNKNAVSPVGAAGLWQLMPATAKQYGISSKQRFSLEPSTNAALKFFRSLHNKFGNWELAIAAYNAGGGRVHKALSKNPSATSVQQLALPLETKQYVKRFFQVQNELRSTSL
jgi:membrane-bound lytic murein transglycosylase D